MNVNYDELILLTGGAFLAVFGFAKMNERSKLLAKGVRVEGVVFDMERDPAIGISIGSDSNSGSNRSYYPVIRFVTADKEWVTEKHDIGSNPAAYDIGDKVNVIYDTSDVKHFIIDDWTNRLAWPVVATIGVLMILGVIMYFFIMQFPGM